MRRPIDSRTHGFLDYASAAALFAVPRLMGWDRKVRRLTDGAALGTIAYAALTDYEEGAYPALSMRQHLAVDLMEGGAFLSAAYMLKDQPSAVRWSLAGYGLFTLAAGLGTQRRSSPGRRTFARPGHVTGGTRTPRGAWVMDDTSDEKEQSMPDQSPKTGGRVAETEWRQSREATYDSHLRQKSAVGRNANPQGEHAKVGESEWRQGKDQGRPDMAKAGAKSHETNEKLGAHDARKGYMGGQGI